MRRGKPLPGLLGIGLGALEAIGAPIEKMVRGVGEIAEAAMLPAHSTPRITGVDIPQDIRYVRIPDGEKGTLATLKIMKALCLSPWGARHPQIALLANRIRDEYRSRDYEGEAAALLDWVKANVKYKLDPAGLEWVQTPTYTVSQRGAGDCDDHAVLLCALALASGFQAGFRTVRGDPGRDDWTHVYAVIGITRNGQTSWYGADSTQNESTLGWDPPKAAGRGMATWVIDPTLMEEGAAWGF